MALLTWPSGLTPRRFNMRLSTNQLTHAAPHGGSEQVVDLLNDRWVIDMELPADTHANMAAIEAFLNAMRGQTNTVALWHFARTAPRGTLASATVAVAAAGASAIVLTGSGTLKAGDMVGVPVSGGTLLVQVRDDVTVATSTSVNIVNRLRLATTAGAVDLTAPTANFRLINQPGVDYVGGFTETVPVQFVEAI